MSENKLTQQEASAKIAEILSEIDSLYSEASDIATESGVSFSFDGPTYGTGGWFDPSEIGKIEWGDELDGWSASSHSC